MKDELKIMCVLYVHDVGGILTLVYEEDGELCFEVTSAEGDAMFDEIGSRLKINSSSRRRRNCSGPCSCITGCSLWERTWTCKQAIRAAPSGA